jgi:hypothetical protein
VLLALSVSALLALALLWQLSTPALAESLRRARAALGPGARASRAAVAMGDPGRERRAERRARALLRSCVNPEEWAMYRELGFLAVGAEQRDGAAATAGRGPRCAYLIYPHEPIVAYLPGPREIVGEYCVTLARSTPAEGGERLPDADDVLAKWLLLRGDERAALADANLHLPGRQVDAARVRRDLARLAHWERRRRARAGAREDSCDARPRPSQRAPAALAAPAHDRSRRLAADMVPAR